MGGKCAKAMALTHPERVSGLIVLDISPVRYTEEDPSWNAVQNIIKTRNRDNRKQETNTCLEN